MSFIYFIDTLCGLEIRILNGLAAECGRHDFLIALLWSKLYLCRDGSFYRRGYREGAIDRFICDETVQRTSSDKQRL